MRSSVLLWLRRIEAQYLLDRHTLGGGTDRLKLFDARSFPQHIQRHTKLWIVMDFNRVTEC